MRRNPFTAPSGAGPQFSAYVALICVCIFWGTTYLGFRVALESVGPATIVCVRNLISGAILLTWAMLHDMELPRGKDLALTGVYGILTIGIGNGALAVAELWTPSGLASLFITTSPFWYAGIDALLPGGDRLRGSIIVGLLVGFAGVLGLVAPDAITVIQEGSFSSGGGIVLGFLLLQFSGATWSLGSLLQRNRKVITHPFVVAGVQQMFTGLAFIVPAILEPQRPVWTTSAVGAVLYLAIFGGIVGYGCYMMALSRLPLAIVSIYTYVNPVVAVFLGWVWYREAFGWHEAAAMAVIFLGIWMVRRASVAVEKLRARSGAEAHQQDG
ncbi:MAG: EamA family transporter [Acidobacteriota bacterium]